MKRNKGKKLIFSLTRNYTIFLLCMAVVFMIAYFVSSVLASKLINSTGKSKPFYNFVSGVEESIDELDFKSIVEIKGFVQVLNSNRKTIKTYGVEPKNVKNVYTEDELLDIIAINNSDDEYNTIVNTIKDDKYGKLTLLIMLPKDKADFQMNLLNVPYSMSKEYINLYLKVFGITIVIYFLLIAAYSIWTTKRINAPLKKIDEALGKIINGDYTTQVDLKGANEFIVVGQTINYLTYKLQRSEEENIRITESKNKMVLDLSHDIKTPITTIRGFSAALSQGLITDEAQKERYYNTIYQKSERVEELINDLFDYVKIDNNIKINKEKVDICEYIREIILKYVDEFEERKFELDIDIQEESIEFDIDTRLFKRAITNLFENALKYNPDGTHLRVTVQDKISYILIEIADNGIGIQEELRGVIFDAFVRGDTSRKSDGGSGLGLSIAQKIINMHNGEIILRSDEKEKTIFTIQLHIL